MNFPGLSEKLIQKQLKIEELAKKRNKGKGGGSRNTEIKKPRHYQTEIFDPKDLV